MHDSGKQDQVWDAVPAIVFATDTELRVRVWNRTAEEQLGWTAAEAIGNPVRVRRECREAFDRCIKQRSSWTGLPWLPHSDGTLRPVHLNARWNEQSELLVASALPAPCTAPQLALAAGVAHDFGNLLRGIDSYTPTNSPARELVNRGLQLVAKLNASSGREHSRREPVDVNALLHKVEADIRNAMPKGPLALHCLAKNPTVKVDPLHLARVFLFLAADVGEFSLEIKTESDDRHVIIQVSSNRPSLDDLEMRTCFTPLSGSLHEVFGIVSANWGSIQPCWRSESGWCFRIMFPAHRERTPNDGSDISGTVLFVNDNLFDLYLAGEALQRTRYRLITAPGPYEALEILEARRNEIDCVILDLNMPKMGGFELATHIRNFFPGLPLGFMTSSQALSDRPAGEIVFTTPTNLDEFLEQYLRCVRVLMSHSDEQPK